MKLLKFPQKQAGTTITSRSSILEVFRGTLRFKLNLATPGLVLLTPKELGLTFTKFLAEEINIGEKVSFPKSWSQSRVVVMNWPQLSEHY